MVALRLATAVLVCAATVAAVTPVTAAAAVRPSPTTASCLTAWNSRNVTALRAFGGRSARPAAMIAYGASAHVHIATLVGTVGSKPSIAVESGTDVVGGSKSPSRAPETCVLTVASTALHVTEVIGLWSGRSVSEWRTLPDLPAGGLAAPPNARLLPNGTIQAQLTSLTK